MQPKAPHQDVVVEDIFDDEPQPSEDEDPQEDTETIDEPEEEETESQAEEEEPVSEPEEEKAQEEEDDQDEEEEESQVSVVGQIKQNIGIDNDKEYDDTIDGVTEIVRDGAEALAQQELNRFFQQYPDVQEYVEYRSSGGDPSKYFQTMNQSSWDEVDIQEDNTDQQERIVRKHLQKEGWDNEDIEDAIDDYKSSGIIYSQANRSLKRLKVLQENEKKELIEQQKRQREQQQEQLEQVWNEVENTVKNNNDLNGLPLPETQKEHFINYIRQPVAHQNGQQLSQRDVDAQKADIETRVTIDYVLYLMNREDFSLGSLIQREAKTENAKSLMELLKNGDGGGKKPKDRTSSQESSSSVDVDVESLPDVSDLMG